MTGAQKVIGLNRDGGFSEALTVPFDHLIRIAPESDLSLEIASVTEPLAVAVHAVKTGDATNRQMPITVIGDGSIGLLICHVLKRLGCEQVRLIGRHFSKLALASQLGARFVFTPDGVPEADESELVFQTAGSLAAFQDGFRVLSTQGHMVCIGYLDPWEKNIAPAIVNGMIRKNQHLSGSFGYSQESFRQAFDGLVTGKFNVTPLIAKIISLADAHTKGFEASVGETQVTGKTLCKVPST